MGESAHSFAPWVMQTLESTRYSASTALPTPTQRIPELFVKKPPDCTQLSRAAMFILPGTVVNEFPAQSRWFVKSDHD